MNVGDRIKQLREKNNMSQIDLAKKIHSTKQSVYKYENGVITNIPSSKIEAIATALNTTPQYLMGWETGESEYLSQAYSIAKEHAFYYLESAFSDYEIMHFRNFDKLSKDNQNKVINYTQNLLQIQKVEDEQKQFIDNISIE